jgi:hypothetical protein
MTSDTAPHRDWSRYLITAPQVAGLARAALAAGRGDTAARWLTEAVARLIESDGRDLPAGMFAEPETTGDRRWDIIVATGFLYASQIVGIESVPWMHAKSLKHEWLYGGDGCEPEQYRNFIRSQTPAVFLDRNILTRPRDWTSA